MEVKSKNVHDLPYRVGDEVKGKPKGYKLFSQSQWVNHPRFPETGFELPVIDDWTKFDVPQMKGVVTFIAKTKDGVTMDVRYGECRTSGTKMASFNKL